LPIKTRPWAGDSLISYSTCYVAFLASDTIFCILVWPLLYRVTPKTGPGTTVVHFSRPSHLPQFDLGGCKRSVVLTSPTRSRAHGYYRLKKRRSHGPRRGARAARRGDHAAGRFVDSRGGPDRAIMYVLSAWTGYRKKEIGSLTKRSLRVRCEDGPSERSVMNN